MRSKHRLSVPENRPPNDKALSAERPIAFLEPASLRPWIPLPARGPFQSSSAPSGDAEPAARRQRLEHMGRSAGQTEMDAVADLREDIRTLGAGGRESQCGFRASGDADYVRPLCQSGSADQDGCSSATSPLKSLKFVLFAGMLSPRSRHLGRQSPAIPRVTQVTRSTDRCLGPGRGGERRPRSSWGRRRCARGLRR